MNPIIVVDRDGNVAAVLASFKTLWKVQPLPEGYRVLDPDKEYQRAEYIKAFEEVCKNPSQWGRWH